MKIQNGLALLGVIALAGAGCMGGSEPAAPQKTTETQRIPDRPLGTTEVQIPENFPTDFPRYPGSKVFSALADESQAILSLTSEDEATIVMGWHRQYFLTNGYTAGEKGAQGNTATETFTKAGIRFFVNTIDQGSTSPKTLFSLRREPIVTE